MLIQAAMRALAQITSPPFRSIVWKSLGLTLALLALVWLALTRFLNWWLSQGAVVADHPMIATIAAFMAGAGLLIGLAFLIPPVGRAIVDAIKLALLALGVNIVALLLLLVPGINVVAFLLANTFLLGREYFTIAAGRFLAPQEIAALRENNRFAVYFAGFMMALLMSIPLVNLFTPVFGTALFVHVYKGLAGRRMIAHGA